MLRPVGIQEINDYLESQERVGALQHVIDEVSSHPSCTEWTCRKGIFYDVNFYYDDKYYFAIIPNKKWLLWYFRKPALKANSYNLQSLEKDFPPEKINETLYDKVSVNNSGENTVKLFGMRDARLLTQKYME